MKILGYLFLFLVAFVASVIWKFPAAGVLPHVNINPLSVVGVTGSVWSGGADQVIAPPPALPLSNVNWRFQPVALLSGSTAANLDFEVLGGNGSGNVARSFDGDVAVTAGTFSVPAANLAQFLPLPVADFGGKVIADIENLELENNLLTTAQGTVIWSNALVTGLVEAKLGQVVLDFEPKPVDGQAAHIGKLSNTDGDLEIKGDFQIDIKGNYRADIRLKPTASASPGLTGALGSLGPIAKRESDGSYRIRNNGNIRNLM